MKKLIVVEGPDRIGKTTLVSKLIETGKFFKQFNFPEKNENDPVSLLMNQMLTDPTLYNTHPAFKSLLFSIDRLKAKRELIHAIESTQCPESPFILCDRYIYSNIAYQIGLSILERRGYDRFGGKSIDILNHRAEKLGDLIKYVEFQLMEIPKPDLVICLYANQEFFAERASSNQKNDDLNDSFTNLQIFINDFFQSSSTVSDQFNLEYWCNEPKIVVNTTKQYTADFRHKDEILNDVLAQMWTRLNLL